MGGEKKKQIQPWEAKLIGRRNRFENTLSYWLKNNVKGGQIQENAHILSDMLLDYMNKGVMNVDVKQYEVFGKKLDRPWSKGAGVFYTSLGLGLGSDFVKEKVKETIDYVGFDPNKPRYYSGAQIAAEVFAPTLMQKDMRPSCHFEDYYMAQFYNETGIQLDEAAMMSDMMEVTCSITDANYNDKQWRQDVMPFIIRGSYQKNLKGIFEQIQEEARLNPAISQEMINDRMDKAQLYLGKIYEDFSLTIANTTDYLEVPLKITNDGEKLKPSGQLKKPLTNEELKKYDQAKQQTLITQKELKSMKAKYQNKAVKPTEDECIQQFYRSLAGAVGPENQREQSYKPGPLKDSSALNQRTFIACATALKKHSELVYATNPNAKNYQELLVNDDLMINDIKDTYNLDVNQIDIIINPETKISDLPKLFNISDEVIYGYDKISEDKMPKIVPPEEKQNSLVNMVNNMLPTQESIVSAFDTAKNFVKEAKDVAVEVGAAIANEVADYAKNVNFDFDFDLGSGLDIDLDNEMQKSGDERFSDHEQEQARLQKLKEEREANERAAAQKIEEIRAAEEKAANELKQKNEALDSLEPWQQKAIGHSDRYRNTWLNSMVVSIGKNCGGLLEDGIDYVADYYGNFMAPDVKNHSVYGKKLDKAWGKFGNISGDLIKQTVTNDTFKNMFKNKLRSILLSPGSIQYTSGQQVAVECFAPSYLQGEMRPPIHFNEAYLAEFYNETGIYPDESSMIGEMMTETLKIKDNNYTDEQWREMIMPAIIQGSYKSQLTAISNQIKEEYINNPAISKELYEQRLTKAAGALGKIYEDFSQTLANNTEYLGAPMKLFDEKRPELTDAQKNAMSPEQLKKYNSQKIKSISSKKDVENILSVAKKANKKTKDMSELFEQFVMNSSGYVIPGEGRLFDKGLAYNDPNRTPGQDKAFIASVVTAREIINNAGKRGFFSKLFNREAAKNEALMCQSVRNTLKSNFMIDDALADRLLDPKTNIMSSFEQLGLNEESILGYKKMEVPDPKEMAAKQQNLSDMVKNWTPKIMEYSSKAIGLAKGVVAGGYQLVQKGANLVQKGVKGLYDYYFNPADDSDLELVDEQQPEDLAKQAEENKKIEQEVQQEVQPEADNNIPENNNLENVQVDGYHVIEQDGEILYSAEEFGIKDDDLEVVDEQPQQEQSQEKTVDNSQQPLFETVRPPENWQPEDDDEDLVFEDTNDHFEDEEFVDPDEKPKENEQEQKEEEKKEEQPQQLENDDDEFVELEEDPEEEPELSEEELKKIDEDSEKDMEDLVGEVKEEQQSMFSFGYWTSGWFSSQKTPEQMVEAITDAQKQISTEIKSIDWNDKKKIAQELGKLQYTESVKSYLISKRWSVKQAETALDPKNLEDRSQKFAETPLFQNICTPILQSCKSSEELGSIPNLAENLNKLTLMKFKEQNKAKQIEQKKKEKTEVKDGDVLGKI